MTVRPARSRTRALCAALIVAAQLLPALDALADTSGQLEFTQKVATLIEARGVAAAVRVEGPLAIRILFEDGKEKLVHLDNLYRGLHGSTDEQDAQIEAFLAPLFVAPSDALGPEQLDHVLPVIREESFVAHVRKTLEKPGNPLLAHLLVDDLFVLYVLDLPDQMRFLTLDDAQSLGASEKGLRERARINLRGRLGEVSVREEGPFYVVRMDDNYESSLLVVEELWRQIEKQVAGRIVATVPNRNVLLFSTADDAAAIASLQEVARQLVAEYSYPISSHLLQRSNGRWVRFE